MASNYLVVFFISLLSICLELFLTRILNFKTFNHIAYVVIPFTLLGLGIGANIYFLTAKRLKQYESRFVIGWSLFFLAFLVPLCTKVLIHFPIKIEYLMEVFSRVDAGLLLSVAYLFVMLPYIIVGFILLYIFSMNQRVNYKLYFCDLIGAGIGAAAFYVLIYNLQVFHSIVLLSLLCLALSFFTFFPKRKFVSLLVFLLGTLLSITLIQEPTNYKSTKLGWENFPNHFHGYLYSRLFALWHPLGRTDAYHLNREEDQNYIRNHNVGTFQININPAPDFYYLSTNFLAGTPVYNLENEALKARNSKVVLFSRAMEAPYIFLSEPKVVVIGAGGGRDIFMAKSHGAVEVKAAEINPVIHWSLSKNGPFYNYSGKVYERDGVTVYLEDGRHLIKKLDKNKYDLVVLNGVDTFSGLSSGAYTFAESYLYTKEAISDYLRVLDDGGIVNINRWIFKDDPRETLRLFVIALDALKTEGIKKPWDHIVIGNHMYWGMTLIKKTPFTAHERQALKMYFETHWTDQMFSTDEMIGKPQNKLNKFEQYVIALKANKAKEFIQNYRYDISVVTDDKPFFYKYYRPKRKRDGVSHYQAIAGAGLAIFITQGLVMLHAVVFSALFIGLPLFKLKKDELKKVPGGDPRAFIGYFVCLGLGFMFIEIPLMQQFVLILGNPIYSLTVVLAALLIFTGIGSLALKRLQTWAKGSEILIQRTTVTLIVLTLLMIIFKEVIIAAFIGQPFLIRVMLITLMIFPIGVCLGVYFPSGLQLITRQVSGVMPWAWGINFGFSVMGSMLAIIIGQYVGFRFTLICACGIYCIASILFKKLTVTT